MTGLVFAVLFALNFVLFPCQGQISLPPGGDTFVVLPGEDVTIAWKIDVGVSDLIGRSWIFLPKDDDTFAQIFQDGDVVEKPQYSPGPFKIIKPSTLILKNVTIQYNGTYRFFVSTLRKSKGSEVTVFVAVTPTVTVNCSSLTTLIASDNFACECKGQGGNPPANVTWYEGDEQNSKRKGFTGKEEQTLRLTNVGKDDSGTYRCEAKSMHEQAKNETVIELIVNYPPEGLYFTDKAVVGKTFTISCESNGRPSPSYTILHNGTKVVSNDKTYTIDVVQYSHAGFYKCIAENKLGIWSMIYNLSIIYQPIISTIGTTNQNFMTTKNSRPVNTAAGSTVVVWHIVVSLVSGFILGILFPHIVSCSRRRRFRNRKPEPKTTEVDTTYQELDLSKMNTEDNYQPLRVNVASYDAGNQAGNDDDSTYTELSKTRDVESNYQSLT